MDDKVPLEEECGIFGIWNHQESAHHTYLGLHSLQHRGQESAGISTFSEKFGLETHREMGFVNDIFDEETLQQLHGKNSIGHVRYSTSGSSSLRDAQPITLSTTFGPLALAHNGNLTNTDEIRTYLKNQGHVFSTDSDTELIGHLITRSDKDRVVDAIIEALKQVEGAYSLLCLTEDLMIGVKDPNGVRPLCLGQKDQSILLASESCSFDMIDAEFKRSLDEGEMVIVDEENETTSIRPFEDDRKTPCVFELIYFSRPDSKVFDRNVYEVRKEMGRKLAQESHQEADIVIPVPDSGVPAAMGYANEVDLPYEMGLVRSHYIGRTFIEPTSSIRHFNVKLKLSPVEFTLKNKDVVVVDDSIVRGTTSKRIVSLLRDSDVNSIHFRVASPPTVGPCYYGIDTPDRDELIASSHTVEEIQDHIEADSLAYLSIEGLRDAVETSLDQDGNPDFCEACFTNDYPIPTNE